MDDEDDGEALAPVAAEWLRRIALGLTTALVVSRVYWSGEGVREEHTGSGLPWVWAVLITLGIALVGMLIGGRTRLRWSKADGAVYALMVLVALSTARADERRVAINLGWEWAGLGAAYFLVRNLPRTAAESSTLAGSVVAAAVAVSAYGIYQVAVELPANRAFYMAHREQALAIAGIAPGSPQQKPYEDRLLGSNEPIATFALTNSLAGYLVGNAVLALGVGLAILRRDRRGFPGAALALGALPLLVVLVCLMMTKSRSAYLGLAVGTLVLLYRERGRLSASTQRWTRVGIVGVAAVLAIVGAATGRLDRQVLTETTKSFRYRVQYWQGAWEVIRREPGAWWSGLGPGNFGAAYLRHKFPWASEEIADPHNMILDVWATAGLWAALALLAALGLALFDILGPPKPAHGRSEEPETARPPTVADPVDNPAEAPPPRGSGWLLACAGGAWALLLAMELLSPQGEGLVVRSLILGFGWGWAVLLGMSAWRRGPIPAAALGAGALAVAVNLLAAGGIGFATVALGLWTALALGLNLHEDRPCGRLRSPGGRGPAFALAAVGAAMIGSFWGSVSPFWAVQAAMSECEAELSSGSRVRVPDFDVARDANLRAIAADKFSVRPMLALAELEYRAWQGRGATLDDPIWNRIDEALNRALLRNPRSLEVYRRRAAYALELTKRLGEKLPKSEAHAYRVQAINAMWQAAHRLHPTSPLLRAELADADAAIGVYSEAVVEGEEALRLDDILREHPDKRLVPSARDRLTEELRRWRKLPNNRSFPGKLTPHKDP